MRSLVTRQCASGESGVLAGDVDMGIPYRANAEPGKQSDNDKKVFHINSLTLCHSPQPGFDYGYQIAHVPRLLFALR